MDKSLHWGYPLFKISCRDFLNRHDISGITIITCNGFCFSPSLVEQIDLKYIYAKKTLFLKD